MNRFRRAVMVLLPILFAAGVLSCSKESGPQQAQQPATSQQATAPSTSQAPSQAPAPAAQATPAPSQTAAAPGRPGGQPATEKHSLRLANYSGTAVTVSLNGNWIGQWDSHTSAPLDTVLQGKNDLTVELADQPNNTVTLEVYARRGNDDVNLLRLNFQGKAKGSYNYSFAAR